MGHSNPGMTQHYTHVQPTDPGRAEDFAARIEVIPARVLTFRPARGA
jgi:hypothetical protein